MLLSQRLWSLSRVRVLDNSCLDSTARLRAFFLGAHESGYGIWVLRGWAHEGSHSTTHVVNEFCLMSIVMRSYPVNPEPWILPPLSNS